MCCMVLLTGREVRTNQLKLDKAGVMVDAATNRIKVNDDESTSVPHIYAIGDVAMVSLCCHGESVLPVSVRCCQLLHMTFVH